jgi:mRNA-degrading endonuclease RelE of RelBE toxin-antitoxin system
MNFKVIAIDRFEKDIKRLVKKYPSLKKEYIVLVEILKINPYQGTAIGNQCFKIRIAIASKGKGKRGGARVITYVKVNLTSVFLLTIYDKSEQGNLSDSDLKLLLSKIKD